MSPEERAEADEEEAEAVDKDAQAEAQEKRKAMLAKAQMEQMRANVMAAYDSLKKRRASQAEEAAIAAGKGGNTAKWARNRH